MMPRRIVVVGTTGSGKSTLAAALARRLGCPHVEMDALHWDPNWTMAPREVFRARVAAAVAGESWVADGNYAKAADLIWPRADLLVWLDYPLPLVLARLFRRTAHRWLTRQELWNGNRERLRDQFTRDSLFLWALGAHARHRRDFPVRLARPEHAHLTVVRLRSPRETKEWLAGW
jgi:adenylate kinase family enzyme